MYKLSQLGFSSFLEGIKINKIRDKKQALELAILGLVAEISSCFIV